MDKKKKRKDTHVNLEVYERNKGQSADGERAIVWRALFILCCPNKRGKRLRQRSFSLRNLAFDHVYLDGRVRGEASETR